MAEALNIPKKKNQFEAVPFVEDMTPHQLKVLVKRMWVNIQELATELDNSREDIALTLDNLLDGVKVNPKLLRERFQYFQVGDAIVEYDSKKNSINVLDSDGEVVSSDIQGYDLKIIRAALKKKLESAQGGQK